MPSRLLTCASLALALVTAAAPAARGAPVPPEMPRLVAIRAAHHPGYDRIVFEFAGRLPERLWARWVTRVTEDASGRPVRVQGNAFIEVTMFPVLAHEMDPPFGTTYGPRRRAFDLPNIAHLVNSGDYEAVVSFGIGLMRRTEILRRWRLGDPSRFVIDVATDFRQQRRSVYFGADGPVVSNGWDLVNPVGRTVPVVGQARGLLLRLFAGPTVEEKASGLRFYASGARRFGELSIRDGIARVTLKGGCDRGDHTISVADQIIPTLRQLPRVDWVKVYGPDGTTLRPWGAGDSTPACLEP